METTNQPEKSIRHIIPFYQTSALLPYIVQVLQMRVTTYYKYFLLVATTYLRVTLTEDRHFSRAELAPHMSCILNTTDSSESGCYRLFLGCYDFSMTKGFVGLGWPFLTEFLRLTIYWIPRLAYPTLMWKHSSEQTVCIWATSTPPPSPTMMLIFRRSNRSRRFFCYIWRILRRWCIGLISLVRYLLDLRKFCLILWVFRRLVQKLWKICLILEVLEVLEEVLGSFAASYKKFFFGSFLFQLTVFGVGSFSQNQKVEKATNFLNHPLTIYQSFQNTIKTCCLLLFLRTFHLVYMLYPGCRNSHWLVKPRSGVLARGE